VIYCAFIIVSFFLFYNAVATAANKDVYITGSDTSIPAVCYACRLWCPFPCHKWGMTKLIFVNPRVKVKGQYYFNDLLYQQMLPAIKRVAKRCLFTKQYVVYGEIGHFLCSVISQGKVVALDR